MDLLYSVPLLFKVEFVATRIGVLGELMWFMLEAIGLCYDGEGSCFSVTALRSRGPPLRRRPAKLQPPRPSRGGLLGGGYHCAEEFHIQQPPKTLRSIVQVTTRLSYNPESKQVASTCDSQIPSERNRSEKGRQDQQVRECNRDFALSSTIIRRRTR